MLPENIPLLEVAIGDNLGAGQLLRKSNYEFRYLSPEAQQPSVALLMPARTQITWLSAAKKAGIKTPDFELSNDGQLLVLDRFDLIEQEDGRIERLGFEDIAALAGLRVRDTLSDRKYQGSYQAVVELLKQLQLPGENLRRFFEQVAFSVMVRNGDAHLKNFGLLYRSATDAWLAPMYDVVTTTIYRYTRSMSETLQQAKTDERIAPPLRSAISTAWEAGLEQAISA